MIYQIRTRTNKLNEVRYSVILEVWADGKRKVVSGGTHGSEKEAVRAGEKLLLQFEGDPSRLQALQGSQTLNSWAKEWLNNLTVKDSTINTYRWRMENWVLPFLGEQKLKDLSVQTLDKWINGAALNHLSSRSKQSALDVLRTCLNKAVRLGFLSQNSAQKVRLDMTKAQRKAEKGNKRIKTWNYEEVERLLEASLGLPIEPIIILGLLAGLRPGEAMAVRWSDIDWLGGTVIVSRTQSRDSSYRPIISETTKTGETRKARITSDGVLRLMRIQEGREGLDSLIYESRTPSTTWKQLRSLCRKAGVKELSPHCLRHTHASLLLENGATLAAVAKQLGHSNPTITASVYWHLVDQEDDTISGIMDRALGRVLERV